MLPKDKVTHCNKQANRDSFIDKWLGITQLVEQFLSPRQIGAELSVDEQTLFPRYEAVGDGYGRRRSGAVARHGARAHQVRVETRVNRVQFLKHTDSFWAE